MPAPHFDLEVGALRQTDGMQLPTVQAAQEEAVRSVAELARDTLRGRPSGPFRIE
jgi:hypothetical protein